MDTVEDLLGPEPTAEDLLGPDPTKERENLGLHAGEFPLAHDATERAAQDFWSNQNFQRATGSTVTAQQGEPVDFDKPLVHLVPELSEEDLQGLRDAPAGQQREAGAANAVARSVNSLTSPNNLALLAATMGLGAVPAMGRAVALGFAAWMGKHAVNSAVDLAEELRKDPQERDQEKIGSLMADAGVNTFLAGVAAHGGLSGQAATPAERVARKLSKEVGRADLGEVDTAARAGGRPTVEELLGPEPEAQPAALRPAKASVPETPAEPYQSAVEQIRAKGATTIRAIQELWPNAKLSREEARAWRERAWPKAEVPATPQTAEGETTNAKQIDEATQPNGDVLNTQGQEPGAGPLPASESGNGIPARGPGQTLPAPTLATPETNLRSVTEPSTTLIHPASAPTIELPVESIKLSSDVPNFKAGSSEETGVVHGQELKGKYERLGAAPIVVWRRTNGDLEVITGRHRLDLARRSGEKTIPAQVVDEAKGFGRAQALTFDAEANIRDGQGSVDDYAHYFQNSPGLTEEEARARGLLSRAKGQAGWDLGRHASDDLRALWRAGKVSEAQAVAIAAAAPSDPRLQRVATGAALRGEKPEVISNLVRVAQLESHGKPAQLDLLGSDDSAMERMQAMAKRAASAQRTIAEQIRAVQGAAKRPELARKLGVDVGDPQGLIKRIEALKGEGQRWENWPLHSDLVEQVRSKGEFQLAKPESVEEQTARLAAEERARQDAALKEKLATQAAAPLVGSVGDIGQGDMLGGGDLFSPVTQQAAKVTHSMASGGGGLRQPAAPPIPAPPTRLPAPAHPLPVPAVSGLRAVWQRQRIGFQKLFSPQNIDAGAKGFSHIMRENNARAALDMVRAEAHLGELRGFFDRTPVPKNYVYDPAQPLPFNYAVMDAFERNRAALPQRLQDFARTFDDEFAWRVAEVQKIKPTALQNLIADYFPHLWEKPGDPNTQAILAEIAAKSPWEGSKAFMKQRTVPYFHEGLARGLKPISDNPVDLLLAKMHQMDKFLAAARTFEETKASGEAKYYPLGRKIPAGRTVVDDPAFTVHAPPFLEVREAFDAGLRRGLMDFIGKMGFSHERVAKLGINQWGQYTTGGEIKSRFGAPDGVIMHEIGHGLEERYGLSRYLLSNAPLRQEMAALADLRSSGVASSEKFRRYAQSPDEQVANAVHAYLYAPEEMARVAPQVQTVLRNIIRSHPELGDLDEIKPGLAIKSSVSQLPLAGPVLAGHWTLPDGSAAVLKNYLSPGLSRWALYRTLRAASNIINAAQLGLSGFHAGFTSLDATISSVTTGLGYLLRGDLTRAGKSFGFAPFAPVANYYVGKAVQTKMIDPTATHVPVGFPKLGLGANVRLSPSADLLTRQIAELAVKGGLRAEVDPFWKTTLTRSMVRAWHEGGVLNYGKMGLLSPWVAVEQSMRPITEYLVPRQKLGVFAQLALQELNKIGWNAPNSEVRAAMARAADSTEDRMGQLTYNNAFMNNMVKDGALLAFRAFGWQLGKFRHLYGGAVDSATLVKGLIQNGMAAAQGKPLPHSKLEVTNRMLYPVALTAVVASVGAIVHRMFTGQNPQSAQDYFFPRTGLKDKDGRDERLALPTYFKDVAADAKAIQTAWMEKSLTPIGRQASHRLNPMIAAASDMWNNQDYYGVEIVHPDDPLGKRLADLSRFAVKQFTPFSVSGTMKLAEDQAPIAQLVLPYIGVVPAKKALLMSPAETLAADITRSEMPIGGRTKEQFDHSQLLKSIVQDIRRQGQGSHAIVDAMAAGQLRASDATQITSMLTTTPFQYQMGRMSPENGMRVWRVANDAERQQVGQVLLKRVVNSKVLEPDKRAAILQELVRDMGLGAPAMPRQGTN